MTSIENRVKNSLAYLSDFDAKSTELVTLNSEVSPSKTKTIQKLLQRIRTFSQLTWFAKPDWLSPVNCARLGWQNIGIDLLECNKCKALISAKLPSSQNIQVYDECCKRLKSLLQNGHSSFCSRRSQPTSSDLCRLTLQNRSVELQDFISRVKGLFELKSHLPIIEESAFTSLQLTLEDVTPLCQLVSNVCRCIGDGDQSALTSACVLALCGWNVSPSASCGGLVECTFCSRKVGLWNYFSQDVEFDDEITTTISGYYDDGDLAVSDHVICTDATESSEVTCELIDAVQESDFQPMNEVLRGENFSGGVTEVEREQRVAVTKEEIPVSFQNPEDIGAEQEIVENVLLVIPSELKPMDVSLEALGAVRLFSGSEKEEMPHKEDAISVLCLTETVTNAADVLSTANTFCNVETSIANMPEEETMTNENGNGSANREMLYSAELVADCEYNHSTTCQYEDILSDVEGSPENCVVNSMECEAESANVDSMHSVEGFANISNLLRNSVGNCDTTNNFIPNQHDLSNAEVGDSGSGDVVSENNFNRSDEAMADVKKQGERTETINTTTSETLPSVSDDIALTADGGSNIIGTPDEHSGNQELQVGQLQCSGAAPAEDALTGVDCAEIGLLEEGDRSLPDDPMKSNDSATSCNGVGDLSEGNLSKSVASGSDKAIADDLPAEVLADQLTYHTPYEPSTHQPDEPTDEVTVQPISQTTPQPAETSTHELDEPTDEITIQPITQITPQPGQPTAHPTDQLTEEQLTDQAIVTDVVEPEINKESGVEPHTRGSVKRAASPEGSKFSAKRRRLARPVRVHFDPVREHRPWCIWVQDLAVKRYQRMCEGNEKEVNDATGHSVAQPPWIRLFRLLLQSDSPNKRDMRRALSLFQSL